MTRVLFRWSLRAGLPGLILAAASTAYAQGTVNTVAVTEPSVSLLPKTAETTKIDSVAIAPAKVEKPPAKLKVPKAGFFVLGAMTYAAAGMDMHDTTDSINYCKRFYCVGDAEGDPIARPITHLPTPAYYATGYAIATGVNWLSWRMGKSARWHKVWWVPQVVSISLNTHGIYTHH